MMKIKIAAAVLILLVVINFLLMVFGLMKPLIFWTIAGITAFIAYFIIPKLKEKK